MREWENRGNEWSRHGGRRPERQGKRTGNPIGVAQLRVENSAGLHHRQEPQHHRCGRGRENRYCSYVEGNLVVNKGELQYYDYSIAASSTSLLGLTHVPNLVAAPVWFVRRMYGAAYAGINMYHRYTGTLVLRYLVPC